MAYAPQFANSPRLLSLVEQVAALRERIQGAASGAVADLGAPEEISPGGTLHI